MIGYTQMNVFDFDKTIYLGESSTSFFRFCLLRRPQLFLWLPVIAAACLARVLKWIDTRKLKELFHGYLRLLKDTENLVERFWDKEEKKTPVWLESELPKGGVVISASPEFLVDGLCRRLGLSVIGTEMNIHTGRIKGLNCKGKEKPVRFRQRYPDVRISAFYSDSLVDTPMAELADSAYLVHGERVSPWPSRA